MTMNQAFSTKVKNENFEVNLNKLDESQQIALTAKNGSYYALPHYEIYTGLVYDADLFTEKAFYFAKGGGWTDEDSEKSCGPDGIYNTYDDGLPSSYEEFYKMMDKMVDEFFEGITLADLLEQQK